MSTVVVRAGQYCSSPVPWENIYKKLGDVVILATRGKGFMLLASDSCKLAASSQERSKHVPHYVPDGRGVTVLRARC